MIYKYTAIIIEPRKHKALHFVLNNALECLPEDWQIVFFHGTNNVEYAQNIVNQLNHLYNNRITTVQLNVDNLNQKTYSKLLANDTFIYQHIQTDYFLIFQTDSMILKSNAHLLHSFLDKNYDYIGAPWLICNYKPTKQRGFIGNGGFSLRKKSTMLEIITNHKWDENIEWQEDLFFTKKYDNIQVIKPEYHIANKFCVEEVFCYKPFACHQVWNNSRYVLFSKMYPECKMLKELQSVEE